MDICFLYWDCWENNLVWIGIEIFERNWGFRFGKIGESFVRWLREILGFDVMAICDCNDLQREGNRPGRFQK